MKGLLRETLRRFLYFGSDHFPWDTGYGNQEKDQGCGGDGVDRNVFYEWFHCELS